MNFKQLQEEVREWSHRNFGLRPTYWPLLGAAEEIGELAHAHLKGEQCIRGTPEKHIADAMGITHEAYSKRAKAGVSIKSR